MQNFEFIIPILCAIILLVLGKLISKRYSIKYEKEYMEIRRDFVVQKIMYSKIEKVSHSSGKIILEGEFEVASRMGSSKIRVIEIIGASEVDVERLNVKLAENGVA